MVGSAALCMVDEFDPDDAPNKFVTKRGGGGVAVP